VDELTTEPVVTVAREDTPHGEVALRRRAEVLELVVDGAFAMDTVDTSTERLLAQVALADVAEPRRVLDGGLGLGFTARAVLADPRVEHLDVVELAEPLVRWARESLVPELAGLEGARCSLHVADVLDVLHGRAVPRGPWDLVLLDVDNGPDFLVHAHNAALYDGPALAAARAAVRPGGALVVWSSHRAPALLAGLEAVAHDDDEVAELVVPVEREGHRLDYALYRLGRAV
jgi:spermidine synthase